MEKNIQIIINKMNKIKKNILIIYLKYLDHIYINFWDNLKLILEKFDFNKKNIKLLSKFFIYTGSEKFILIFEENNIEIYPEILNSIFNPKLNPKNKLYNYILENGQPNSETLEYLALIKNNSDQEKKLVLKIINSNIKITKQAFNYAVHTNNDFVLEKILTRFKPDLDCLVESCIFKNIKIIIKLLELDIQPDSNCIKSLFGEPYHYLNYYKNNKSVISQIIGLFVESGYELNQEDKIYIKSKNIFF